MPRSGRGGTRTGRPGASYSNRTDLNTQPVRTGPSQSYGQRAELEEIQRAAPLPAEPPLGFGSSSVASGEPVTAGLPIGPGAGPSAAVGDTLDEIEVLRAVYARYPNEGLRRYLHELGVG